MFPVEISICRINAAIEEIDRLNRADFPYEDSRAALAAISGLLAANRSRFDPLDLRDNDATAQQLCRESLLFFFSYLEIVGLILRSTDPRNNFEVYGSLKRLFRKALQQEDVKLILSSEWSYSPMIYRDVDDLDGFVFVGFPTTEANNPLLLPLAGHELGHAVWKKRGYEAILRNAVLKALQAKVVKDLSQLQASLPGVGLTGFLIDFGPSIQDKALAKMEEYFCDFLGLKMFGEAYLLAFGYLLGPGPGFSDYNYPSMEDRVAGLTIAAGVFGYNVPACFNNAFLNASPVSAVSQGFWIDWADEIARSFRDDLIKLAETIVSEGDIPLRSLTEVKRVEDSFGLRIPTSASVADILNAAWNCSLRLWDKTRHANPRGRLGIEMPSEITELTLKSIEILEIKTVLK